MKTIMGYLKKCIISIDILKTNIIIKTYILVLPKYNYRKDNPIKSFLQWNTLSNQNNSKRILNMKRSKAY